MFNEQTIGVVIPSYKVRKFLKKVVSNLPEYIDYIIVVDDACPEKSFQVVEEMEKVVFVKRRVNSGVGAAVISGYKKALELDIDIVVKIDGDGQMNNNYIPSLILPLIQGKVDYTKGNRFRDFKALRDMPKVRLFGNSILSFLSKVSSGYWSIMDPTNGFTAISKETIESLDLDQVSERYFFESDMLINLNINNKVVKDISMPAQYGEEESSLNVKRVIYQFPPKILKGFFKRIFYKYFVYNFDMCSIYILTGLPLLLFGIIFGVMKWSYSVQNQVDASIGTVMLATLPIILGVEFLLQAINIDIGNEPKFKQD